jgi:hypothetical protein
MSSHSYVTQRFVKIGRGVKLAKENMDQIFETVSYGDSNTKEYLDQARRALNEALSDLRSLQADMEKMDERLRDMFQDRQIIG